MDDVHGLRRVLTSIGSGDHGRWQSVAGATFEREARRHTLRLAERGELVSAIIDEWWSDTGQQGQIDVVGIERKRWLLAGEAKWSAQFTATDLRQLERNIALAGQDPSSLILVSWSIGGPAEAVTRVRPTMRHFTASDMVGA